MLFTVSTFKALGSKTRIEILKKLKSRRMTLSELSGVLGMHASTVGEHLEILRSAGLVSRADEGYKWKYYFLTKEGDGLFFARGANIALMVGISAVATGIWGVWNAHAVKAAALPSAAAEMTVLSKFYESTVVVPNPPAYAGYVEVSIILGAGIVLVLYGIYGRIMKVK